MKATYLHTIVATVVLSISVLITGSVQAQTPPFPFEGFVGYPHTYKLDARSVAMAESGIADPAVFSSFTINPALLSFHPNKMNLYVSGFQNWQNNLTQFDITSPALTLAQHSGLVRFSYFQPILGGINPLGDNPQPEPDLSLYQMDVVYAFAISSVLSAGIQQTLSFGNNENAQYATYMVNSGLIYDPDGVVSYAIVLNGLGRSLKYEFIEDGTTILGSRSIPVSLQIGASFRFPMDDDHPYLTLSLANEKRFGEKGLWYNGGLEIKPISYVALRSGLMFQPDDLTYVPRYGIGFGRSWLQVDYGVSPNLFQNERYHLFGITIQF